MILNHLLLHFFFFQIQYYIFIQFSVIYKALPCHSDLFPLTFLNLDLIKLNQFEPSKHSSYFSNFS